MAKDKKGFLMYADWKEIFNELDDDDAGKLIKHVLSYVNDENPITDNKLVKMAFIPIKLALKRDLKKFELVKEKRSIAGKKSAEIRAKQKLTNSTSVNFVQQTLTNSTVNDNVSVNDNVNVKDNEIVSSIDDILFNVDNLVLRILDDKKLISNFCAYNKTDEKTFKSKLNEFTLFLKSKGVHTKQHKEFIDYFGNWFRKKQTITKTDETHKKIIL